MIGIDAPDQWFASAPESQRASGDDWEWTDSFSREEEILRYMQLKTLSRLRADQMTELKAIYLKLARRFHPDLADTDDERTMLQVTHASQCRHLEGPRELGQKLDQLLPGWSADYVTHRLAWARRKYERLDGEAEALLGRIRQLRASETFPLWFNSVLGSTVTAHRAAALHRDIDRDIDREQRNLDEAKLAFKMPLVHYAAEIARSPSP